MCIKKKKIDEFTSVDSFFPNKPDGHFILLEDESKKIKLFFDRAPTHAAVFANISEPHKYHERQVFGGGCYHLHKNEVILHSFKSYDYGETPREFVDEIKSFFNKKETVTFLYEKYKEIDDYWEKKEKERDFLDKITEEVSIFYKEFYKNGD